MQVYNRMPRYFIRITDNVDTKKTSKPFSHYERAENKYIMWSTYDAIPLCKVTRREIHNEVYGLIHNILRMAALDGKEAVASIFAKREDFLNEETMTVGDILEIYDELPTLAEWKRLRQ